MDPRISRIDLKTALRSVADLAAPRLCLSCGRKLLIYERHLCIPCRADIPFTHYASRTRNPMADSYNTLIEADRYQYAAALFFFRSDSDSVDSEAEDYSGEADYTAITKALKYHANFGAGRYFADMLGSELARAPHFADVDLVTCVPLHPLRRYRRGYNQAEIIARRVALALGARFDGRLLRRVRRTRSQASLAPAAKAANVSGAFAARPARGSVLHLLIVDDVFTTGNTLAACTVAARTVLPPSCRISVATLAFVENNY